jgi:prepilin-type processing-associated H-X9-DG protein
MRIFACPSSPQTYAATYLPPPNPLLELSLSSYAGCHHDSEAPIDKDNNGVLFLNSRISFSDITDGSSQTILIGEKVPLYNDFGWLSGTRSTLRNTGPFSMPTLTKPRVTPDEEGSLTVGGFGSFHSSGSNFAFADGSVRYVAASINMDLYRKLGNRHDGELLGPDNWDW